MRNIRQAGFSLVELVIVIVILGLLAATAIPRFLNVTDDAENASVEGVSGGLVTAVSFVRSQWEVDGRSSESIILDGTTVFVDDNFGYPTGISANGVTGMSSTECRQVFEAVLQNAPSIVLFNEDARSKRYTARVLKGSGGDVIGLDGTTTSGVDLCVYHQVATLSLNTSTGKPKGTLDLDTDKANGITYNPATGAVVSFSN